MKKFVLLLLLLLVMYTSPALALFCQNCGKPISDEANFCANCGKPKAVISSTGTGSDMSGASSVPGVPGTPGMSGSFSSTSATMPGQPPSLVPVMIYESADIYAPVDQYEALLFAAKPLRPPAEAVEYRIQAVEAVQIAGTRLTTFSPWMAKMHTLQARKLDALEGFQEAWELSITGSIRGQAAAKKEWYHFVIGKINEMLRYLQTHKNTSTVLLRIQEMEIALDETSGEHTITAPFLRIGDVRVGQNQPIWVAETRGAHARVVHMGESALPMPFSGWVTLDDLWKRTSWKVGCPQVIYRTNPPPREILIIERDSWRHRRWRKEPPSIILKLPHPGNDHDRDRNPGKDRNPHRDNDRERDRNRDDQRGPDPKNRH
ncbi:MAG: zinc ribbon domain-containing protein [Candidatus Ozemobacteraceae bacterium]